MGEKVQVALGCITGVLLLGYGLVWLGAGAAGLDNTVGWGWTIAAIIAVAILRFTPPIMYGAFVYAQDAWGWHWGLAALFALPGLLFMIPFVISLITNIFRK